MQPTQVHNKAAQATDAAIPSSQPAQQTPGESIEDIDHKERVGYGGGQYAQTVAKNKLFPGY